MVVPLTVILPCTFGIAKASLELCADPPQRRKEFEIEHIWLRHALGKDAWMDAPLGVPKQLASSLVMETKQILCPEKEVKGCPLTRAWGSRYIKNRILVGPSLTGEPQGLSSRQTNFWFTGSSPTVAVLVVLGNVPHT